MSVCVWPLGAWRRLKAAITLRRYSSSPDEYPFGNSCRTCEQPPHSGIRDFDIAALTASPSSGCRYCNFVVNVLNHFYELNNSVKICMFQSSHSIQYWDENAHSELELYTPVGRPPAWPGIPQTPSALDEVMNGSPQSNETYEFIRSCLRECDASHPECQIAGQELPTRLLNVQEKGAQQVILVETQSLPIGYRTTYIALSYCWGKGQSLTLECENLEAMKSGLTVSSLPQTLQDAITVTRALGQQYLWVDALCIIQNSPSDWAVESSRMASVYRNAYLTIAAATASDVTEGFLSHNYRETNPWYRGPYHEEWVNHDGESTILGVRLPIKRSIGFAADIFGTIPIPPWNLRGWTLHEQLLSRRLLKYHAYELRWVCQNKSAYQCHSKSYKVVDHLDNPIRKLESAVVATKEWHRIVINYTSRDFTNPLDKLPAISGLAKVFQQVILSQYIAGLWKNQLPWDLVWVVDWKQTRYAPELYIAPTFSWASISSQVGRYKFSSYSDWTSQAVVEDVCSIVDGEDPLGRVKDGWIRLRGHISKADLVDIEWGYKHSLKTRCLPKEAFLLHDTWLEKFEATNEHGNVEVSVRRMRRPSSATPQANETPVVQLQQGAVVRLLFLGYTMTRSRFFFHFLVLGLSGDKPGMYERLGLVRYWDRNLSQREVDKFISRLKSSADEYKAVTIV